MAEALISPGVFLRENDQSQITAGPITVGSALVGPTVTGKVNIPTVVTSYSEYQAIYGTTFISGGNTQEYLTSVAAYNYFQQGGTSLLVTRVASGSYTPATASVPNHLATYARAAFSSSFGDGAFFQLTGSAAGKFYLTSSTTQTDAAPIYYILTGSNAPSTILNIVNKINSLSGSFGISGSANAATASLTATATGETANAFTYKTGSINTDFTGGTVTTYAFNIETLSVGTAMNNNQGATTAVSGLLPSGSANNIRWQITQADSGSGYFTVLVRQGNDYTQGQTVLETWTNLSLDPNQANYVAYVIGDQTQVVAYDESGLAYLQNVGNYPNQSRYIRISDVYTPTPNYLDPKGQPQAQYTGSIPLNGSGSANGSFGNAIGAAYGGLRLDGTTTAPLNLFESIPSSPATTPTNNTQGLINSNYDTAIDLLANKDSYVYNAVYLPGLTNQNGPNQISTVLSTSQNRGDNIAVVDLVSYGQTITAATQGAQSYDNSYGAAYWPWLQIRSNSTGRLHFVPASTVIPGVYEYNDKVSAEWFAPAGLNRGGLPTVIQPEYRLTVNQRNTLYSAKVNPIAVFPGQGTVVYGQKTLQARASALDRVNVRRLLIALKSYIGQIAETLVFEQNTAVTRNKFLSQVNPYLEYVQQRQGLYSFRVVMDETNNTPDVIDRNLLVGAIYLQPTRTAEFIQLDFNILPTGVTFG